MAIVYDVYDEKSAKRYSIRTSDRIYGFEKYIKKNIDEFLHQLRSF